MELAPCERCEDIAIDWDEARKSPHARNVTLIDPAFVRHVAYTVRQ